jgi:hypothetical protein
MITDHDVGVVANALDPGTFPVPFCGILDPNNANGECDAMCDLYCANEPGNFTNYLSGCEGFCRGGTVHGQPCTIETDCEIPGDLANSGFCVGRQVNHPNLCTCQCLEVGGSPAPPGGLLCGIGIRTLLETALPCDELDVNTIQGDQCLPYTTETLTAEQRTLNANFGSTMTQIESGTRKTCAELQAGNMRSFVQWGITPAFDDPTGLSDNATMVRQTCKP